MKAVREKRGAGLSRTSGHQAPRSAVQSLRLAMRYRGSGLRRGSAEQAETTRGADGATMARMHSDFGSLALSPSLLAVVAELGYDRPTPIQASCIPLLMAGQDIVGQSQTGSGKTAAFALPILHSLNLELRALQALVLCPTRELCAQVAREMRKLGRRHQGLHVLESSGGQPVRLQARALARGVHIVVATPGRLLDHLGRGTVDLQGIKVVILDEADRMLDMGFQADVERILSELPPSRQTVLFSATFPHSIEAMSATHQRSARRITIDEEAQIAPDIRQCALVVEHEQKQLALCWALRQHSHESALIFCNLKATVTALDRALAALGLSVECLHGNLEQFERDQVMARFRNQSVRYLVATDVAARGIDVTDLDLVVNYELPQPVATYIHRIGRTGRAGKLGMAISLTRPEETWRLDAIEKRTLQSIERSNFESSSSPSLERLGSELSRSARMVTIQVSAGRKDKLRPGDILGALTSEGSGLCADDVGKIEVHERLTYVAVSSASSLPALFGLNRGRVKGKQFRATLVETVRPSIRAR